MIITDIAIVNDIEHLKRIVVGMGFKIIRETIYESDEGWSRESWWLSPSGILFIQNDIYGATLRINGGDIRLTYKDESSVNEERSDVVRLS